MARLEREDLGSDVGGELAPVLPLVPEHSEEKGLASTLRVVHGLVDRVLEVGPFPGWKDVPTW